VHDSFSLLIGTCAATPHHINRIFLSHCSLISACQTLQSKNASLSLEKGRRMRTCDHFLCSCPTQTDIKMCRPVGDALIGFTHSSYS
jgi:hypothetical protein